MWVDNRLYSEFCEEILSYLSGNVWYMLFVQEYIAIVDKILDPKTEETWRNALAV